MILASELEKILKVLGEAGATGFRYACGPADAKEEIEIALSPSVDMKESEKDLDVKSPTLGFHTLTFDEPEDNE